MRMQLFLSILYLLMALLWNTAHAEDMTITTYYPSPNGTYDALSVKRLSVGDTNADGYINASDVSASSGYLLVADRLGIGTTTPQTQLQINAADEDYAFPNPGSTARGALFIRSTSSDKETGITFSSANSNNAQAGIYVHQDSGAGTHMYLATTDSYATGPQARMTILNNGNVGIGTVTPTGHASSRKALILSDTTNDALFEIWGSAGGKSVFQSVGGSTYLGNLVKGSGAGNLYLGSGDYTGNYYYLTLQGSNGHVGIGTTTPGAKLDVYATTSTWNSWYEALRFSNPSHSAITFPAGGLLFGLHSNRYFYWADTTNGWYSMYLSPDGYLTVRSEISGGNTSTGWALGKGAWGPDAWLRLTTSVAGSTYHNFACGPFWANGAQRYDLAEVTPVKKEDALEEGDAVVIDKDNGLRVKRSSRACDTMVYGIISSYEHASMVIGGQLDPSQAKNNKENAPVALVGRVSAKVSAENGPIRVGDLLTTSNTPGHLMRCADLSKCAGAIAGKALQPLEKGKGLIKILVTLQ